MSGPVRRVVGDLQRAGEREVVAAHRGELDAEGLARVVGHPVETGRLQQRLAHDDRERPGAVVHGLRRGQIDVGRRGGRVRRRRRRVRQRPRGIERAVRRHPVEPGRLRRGPVHPARGRGGRERHPVRDVGEGLCVAVDEPAHDLRITGARVGEIAPQQLDVAAGSRQREEVIGRGLGREVACLAFVYDPVAAGLVALAVRRAAVAGFGVAVVAHLSRTERQHDVVEPPAVATVAWSVALRVLPAELVLAGAHLDAGLGERLPVRRPREAGGLDAVHREHQRVGLCGAAPHREADVAAVRGVVELEPRRLPGRAAVAGGRAVCAPDAAGGVDAPAAVPGDAGADLAEVTGLERDVPDHGLHRAVATRGLEVAQRRAAVARHQPTVVARLADARIVVEVAVAARLVAEAVGGAPVAGHELAVVAHLSGGAVGHQVAARLVGVAGPGAAVAALGVGVVADLAPPQLDVVDEVGVLARARRRVLHIAPRERVAAGVEVEAPGRPLEVRLVEECLAVDGEPEPVAARLARAAGPEAHLAARTVDRQRHRGAGAANVVAAARRLVPGVARAQRELPVAGERSLPSQRAELEPVVREGVVDAAIATGAVGNAQRRAAVPVVDVAVVALLAGR